MPPRTSESVESSSGEGPSRQSARPGDSTWRTADVAGSVVHTLDGARIEGRQNHLATDKPPGTAGTHLRSRIPIETVEASSGTAVAAPFHTTYWVLLKQPDN